MGEVVWATWRVVGGRNTGNAAPCRGMQVFPSHPRGRLRCRAFLYVTYAWAGHFGWNWEVTPSNPFACQFWGCFHVKDTKCYLHDSSARVWRLGTLPRVGSVRWLDCTFTPIVPPPCEVGTYDECVGHSCKPRGSTRTGGERGPFMHLTWGHVTPGESTVTKAPSDRLPVRPPATSSMDQTGPARRLALA